MNINLLVRSYNTGDTIGYTTNLSCYILSNNKSTVGITNRDSESGSERVRLLKSAAHKHICGNCPKHLVEEVQFLKIIDYLTWNNRPSLLLIPRKSVLGLAAAHLYKFHSEIMSSTLDLTEKFSKSIEPLPKTVISFLDPHDFFNYFNLVGVPQHGAIFNLEARSSIETLLKIYKYSASELIMPAFGVQLSMPVVTWGVSE